MHFLILCLLEICSFLFKMWSDHIISYFKTLFMSNDLVVIKTGPCRHPVTTRLSPTFFNCGTPFLPITLAHSYLSLILLSSSCLLHSFHVHSFGNSFKILFVCFDHVNTAYCVVVFWGGCTNFLNRHWFFSLSPFSFDYICDIPSFTVRRRRRTDFIFYG